MRSQTQVAEKFVIATGYDFYEFLRLMDRRYVFNVPQGYIFIIFSLNLILTNSLLSYQIKVNLVCTKVKGEPIYEVVKPIPAHQELIVYYLPERPEELFFVRMRNTLYRQTMDSILEGKTFFCFVIFFVRASLLKVLFST